MATCNPRAMQKNAKTKNEAAGGGRGGEMKRERRERENRREVPRELRS